MSEEVERREQIARIADDLAAQAHTRYEQHTADGSERYAERAQASMCAYVEMAARIRALPATPTAPDMEGAIRTGCIASDIHLTCSYPECKCKQIPRAIRAALTAALPALHSARITELERALGEEREWQTMVLTIAGDMEAMADVVSPRDGKKFPAPYMREQSQKLRALLASRPTPTAGEGWRDIKTAPKDGSEVLFPIEFVGRAYWDDELKRWVLSYPLHMDYVNNPTRYRLPRASRPAQDTDAPDPLKEQRER